MIPQKYRHRAAAIESVLSTATLDKQEAKALQNGYAFGDTKQLVDAKTDELYKADGGNNADVPFEVVCSYSNWFDAHPEKIAGTPEISSSLMFPVKIKGTRQDVDRMFANINKY